MTLIEFRNYSFTHLGRSNKALKNVSLKIEQGTTVGILGIGGSGKSTFIKTLGGLAPEEVPGIEEGEILIEGKNSRELSPLDYSQMVGVVLDKPVTQLLGLTVLDDVSFGPSNLGLEEKEIRERVDFALTVTRLKGLESRNPEELSGGQQQSLAIADILAMRPKVLALDEPVSMLDSEGKERVLSIIKNLVREQNSTVVITESGLDLESIIGYLDRLVVLHGGEVVLDGDPHRVIMEPLLDEIGVGRTQMADLFLRFRKKTGIGNMPFSVDEAEKALRPLVASLRFASHGATGSQAVEEPVVSVSNLRHTYPPDVHALKGVDMNIPKGSIIGLVGQNGSGKTTLCLHLVGVLKASNPDSKIQVAGLDVSKERIQTLIRHINYVFQNPDNQLFQEDIRSELAYSLRLVGADEAKISLLLEKSIKQFALAGYLDYELPALPRDVRTILAMASVLVLEPSVIILDEPTNAMDRKRSAWFLEELKRLNREGLTIVIVSHNMEFLGKVCTRLVVMNDGKIIKEGDTRSVFTDPEVLATAKVKPPQISQLAQRFSSLGFPQDVLTVDEFYSALYPKGGP
ncbi:MAG: energy-coupling factor transporter ATPase [Nitrososphaerales archaeon]|nr:energy-coupling factor transporter ATPase [Nitrososphaerales archaeon]